MEEATLSLEPSLDKSVTVSLQGWRPNLRIQYSVEFHAGVSYLSWRIQDTEQIFKIPATTVYEKHGLKFSEHFSLVLKTFREDYKEWESQGFPEQWMKRYHRIYHNLIS